MKLLCSTLAKSLLKVIKPILHHTAEKASVLLVLVEYELFTRVV